ncbi:MAG: TonB-dependent receptor [bacterium]|nr:TonB-dependent receptor [bacterium]
MSKIQIFIFFIIIATLSPNLTFGEEKPDINLPGVTIIGRDRSKAHEKIEPKNTAIEIKEKIDLTKDSVKESAIEIDLPSVEDKSIIQKKKKFTSSFTISEGNFNSLNYQYLYGRKVKEANILFILNRSKSGGFIISNQRYNKHSGDKISLNFDLPLKISRLEREFFLSTEAKYKENEESLPFNQDKEIIKDLSFSLNGRHVKAWNSKLSFVLTNTKTKLIHDNIDNIESDNINFDIYFYTNLKKYLSKDYPLNLNLKIQREAIENIKKWNYLTFAESNNIEIRHYTINIGANYCNYDNSSTLGFKLDIFYPYRKDIKVFTVFKREAELPTFSKIYGNEKYIKASSYSPQKLNYGECGIQYQIKNGFLINSSILAKEVKDFISWKSININNNQLHEPFNIQKARITGLGIKVKKELLPNIICLSDFTYNFSTRNKTSDQKIPFIPKEEIKTNLKITNFKGIDMEFIGTYKGSRYAHYNQNDKLKSYLLLDFKISKSIDDQLHVFMSGDNIFNRKYQIRPEYFGNLATIKAGIIIKI